MDYQNFVTYTVLTSMIALPRTELREKVRVFQKPFNKENAMNFCTQVIATLHNLDTVWLVIKPFTNLD